jgi:hypothetical protein
MGNTCKSVKMYVFILLSFLSISRLPIQHPVLATGSKWMQQEAAAGGAQLSVHNRNNIAPALVDIAVILHATAVFFTLVILFVVLYYFSCYLLCIGYSVQSIVVSFTRCNSYFSLQKLFVWYWLFSFHCLSSLWWLFYLQRLFLCNFYYHCIGMLCQSRLLSILLLFSKACVCRGYSLYSSHTFCGA